MTDIPTQILVVGSCLCPVGCLTAPWPLITRCRKELRTSHPQLCPWKMPPGIPNIWEPLTRSHLATQASLLLLEHAKYAPASSLPLNVCSKDFPGSPVVQNLPCNAGDMGLIPGRETKMPHARKQLNLRATHESVHHNKKCSQDLMQCPHPNLCSNLATTQPLLNYDSPSTPCSLYCPWFFSLAFLA